VEEHEQATWPSHPGKLAQLRLGIGQVVDKAGGEDGVNGTGRKRQRTGIGQHQRRAGDRGRPAGRLEH
jgi:hypothetical protein